MTLNEHVKSCQELVAEAIKKGIDPDKIEVYATHGASGESNELSSGCIRTSKGDELGPVCDLPKGTKYIDFYIGN